MSASTSGFTPLNAQNAQKHWVKVQYLDDQAVQVLELDQPTLQNLKEKINKNTDVFLGQDIEVYLKSGPELECVSQAPAYVQVLIERASFADMPRFQIQLKRGRASVFEESLTSVLPISPASSKVFDCFLSYQWGSKTTVKDIFEDLTTKHKLDVWFDENNMSGSINQAMAEGIDSSKVFVPVLTLAYQRSSNCLVEIRYAKDRQKPQVPVRLLHQGDVAQGEVFAITAALLYADFAGKEPGSLEWDNQIAFLVREIKQRQIQIPAPVAAAVQAPVDSVKLWLKPVDIAVDAERHKSAYVEGTRMFYLESVHSWLKSADVGNVLWLNGGAGLGKSVIAWLISQRLPAKYVLGSIFYCRHDDVKKSSAEQLVATTIWNLCNVLPSFRKFCEVAWAEDDKNGASSILKDAKEAFKQIVVEGLRQLDSNDKQKNVLMIIDALDECGAPSSNDRRKLLELLVEAAEVLPPFVRIFTTGRPEQDVFHTMMTLDSMVLVPNDEENKRDMNMFVEAALSKSFPDASLGPEDVTTVSAEIFERSSGIFQFARLACDELAQVPAHNVVATIKEFGAGVDGVYEQFFRSTHVNTNNFRLVMKVVLAAKEPIPQDVIAELLGVASHVVGQVLVEIHRILDVSDHGKVKVMHKSLLDHLVSSKRCSDRQFFIKLLDAKKDIAVSCLKFILQHYALVENKYEALNGTPGFITDNSTAQYAFKFWLDHLDEAGHDVFASWKEWKEFASVNKFGPAVLCIGIMWKKDWLVQAVLQAAMGEACKILVSMARQLKVFGSTLLYEAARRGLTAACKSLILNGGENVDCRGFSWGDQMQYGESNRTPLMVAAMGSHVETVLCLLEMGADHSLTDTQGWNASKYGCSSAIDGWLERLTAKDSKWEFFKNSHDEGELQEWFLINSKSLDAIDEYGMAPLHVASQKGHLEIVKWLVQQGANVNAGDVYKWTPLLLASQNGHLEVVKWLMQQGTMMNAEDVGRWTPLHVASQNGHLELVQWLVQHGANVNAENVDKTTPLHVAARNGQVAVMKCLGQYGADVNAKQLDESTPLHAAALNGNFEAVQWLVQEGSSVNAEMDNKSTPLHCASQSGDLEVVKCLVEYGAIVSAKNENMLTPLHNASLYGHVDVAKWLVLQGANVNDESNKWTPLHISSQNGHLEIVKFLVQQGANLNAALADKWTPLHIASQNGHLEIVKCLVQHGADMSAANKKKSTPLHIASQHGHLEVVRWLVEQGANVNAENEDKSTPLYIASYSGHLEVVQYLVEQGSNVNAEGNKKSTPLYIASEYGHLEVLKWLVHHGANVNAEVLDKSTPLHVASQNGHLDVVKLLVAQHANVNAEMDKLTPLHFASQNGHLEVAKCLVEHGADVNAEQNSKSTPLHMASQNGHIEVVMWLVQQGANVNAEKVDKSTPIHVASQGGYLEVVQWLVQHGGNVNAEAIDINKSTPLYLASESGHLNVVEWLVQHGANVDAEAEEKPTPLLVASQNGHSEVVKFLVEQGANVNAQVNKLTPLHLASQNGHIEVVKCLVQHGADMSAENKNKATPLHVACDSGYLGIARWLVQQGANVNAQDVNKWVPLHIISRYGDLEFVKWLVLHNANPFAITSSGETPSDIAQREGHDCVAEFLKVQVQPSSPSSSSTAASAGYLELGPAGSGGVADAAP